MNFRNLAAIRIAVSFVLPFTSAESQPSESTPKRSAGWRFSEPRPLGDREVSAGFGMWGPRPLLILKLSLKKEDKKPIPISRFKVTVRDNNGKPLVVAKHYEDGTLLFGRDHHTAFFQVGTFVQNIQPKDVSTVTIIGFGGKLVIRFVDGNAQSEKAE